MKQSNLNAMKVIVTHMDEVGWTNKCLNLKPFELEINNYCNVLSKSFTDLAVLSMSISELKYTGYKDLIKNPELHDEIVNKSLESIAEKELEIKDIEHSISDIILLINDLKERVLQLKKIK